MLAPLLFLVGLAHAERPLWGVRGTLVQPGDNVQKYVGSPLPGVEGFGDFKLGARTDLEIAVAGWTGASVENGTAINGATTTRYHVNQTMSVVPVLATLGTGSYHEKYDVRVGAGVGLYTVKLDRTITYDDPATQASFGQTMTHTSVTAGPHIQLASDMFFSKNVAASVFLRWAYAPATDSFSRYLTSANGNHSSFAESDRLGNVGGFTFGYGFTVRL